MTTATQTQLRRDTRSNIAAQTPAVGEPAWDTTNDRLWMGDGSTAGGLPVAMGKDIQQGVWTYLPPGGTANAITVSYAPDPGPPTDGQILRIKLASAITGAATINPNGHGAAPIKKKSGGALIDPVSGDTFAGGIYEFEFDGANWQIMSELNAGGGTLSVSQGDLNTSTGSVSQGSGGSNNFSSGRFTLPGGSYGFYPQISGAANTAASIAGIGVGGTVSSRTIINTSTGVSITLSAAGAGDSISATQRYITSSPPFDLGDGALHGFIFAKINKAGEIVATYIADVPPWAYNGPTDIRAHYRDARGRKYRRVPKKRSLEEIIDGASLDFVIEEITQAHKNADMPLIPHPFPSACDPEHTIVLLDPLADRLAAIMAHYAHGGDDEVLKALHSGKIYADNEFLTNRKGPPGVAIAPLRFKYSRK